MRRSQLVAFSLHSYECLKVPVKQLASKVASQEGSYSVDPSSFEYVLITLPKHRNNLHSKGHSGVQAASAPNGIVSTNVECTSNARPSCKRVGREGSHFVGDEQNEEHEHQSTNTFAH
jgi:hypothetical protein